MATFAEGVIRNIIAPTVVIVVVKVFINPTKNAGFSCGSTILKNTAIPGVPRSLAASSVNELIWLRLALAALVVTGICLKIQFSTTIAPVPVKSNGGF